MTWWRRRWCNNDDDHVDNDGNDEDDVMTMTTWYDDNNDNDIMTMWWWWQRWYNDDDNDDDAIKMMMTTTTMMLMDLTRKPENTHKKDKTNSNQKHNCAVNLPWPTSQAILWTRIYSFYGEIRHNSLVSSATRSEKKKLECITVPRVPIPAGPTLGTSK